MKIDINKIPAEGLILKAEAASLALDLETDIVKFPGPIDIKAQIIRITNAVTVDLTINASMHMNYSCCLEDFKVDFEKKLRLNYTANKLEPIIDLGPDIRGEIILDYPVRPLCSPDCKGLCPECGENLNEGGCSCGST